MQSSPHAISKHVLSIDCKLGTEGPGLKFLLKKQMDIPDFLEYYSFLLNSSWGGRQQTVSVRCGIDGVTEKRYSRKRGSPVQDGGAFHRIARARRLGSLR